MNAGTLQRATATLSFSLLLLLATGAAAAADAAGGNPKDAASPRVLVFGLGSRCRYCVQLKEEIAKVTAVTGDAVKFEDYRVDRDTEAVRQYRVVLSPTLVFLDASGAEVFRKQGLMDAAEIQEKLVTLKLWTRKG